MRHVFEFTFTVDAPLAAVQAFHADTNALRKLNPPFVIVKLQRVDPMADGSISEFTMWVGPMPIHWRAVHSQVGPQGFIDTQENGPMAFWQHTHRFDAIGLNLTRIQEHIVYEYPTGWHGLLPRLLFSRLGLTALFNYRKWVTRKALNKDKSR